MVVMILIVLLQGLIIMKDKNLLYTVSTEVVVDCPMKFRSEQDYEDTTNMHCDLIYLPFAFHKRVKNKTARVLYPRHLQPVVALFMAYSMFIIYPQNLNLDPKYDENM